MTAIGLGLLLIFLFGAWFHDNIYLPDWLLWIVGITGVIGSISFISGILTFIWNTMP